MTGIPVGILGSSVQLPGGGFEVVESFIYGAESNATPHTIPKTQPVEPGDFIVVIPWYYLVNLDYNATNIVGLGATWTRDKLETQNAGIAPSVAINWAVAASDTDIVLNPHSYRSGYAYWCIRGADPASFVYEMTSGVNGPVMSAGPNALVAVTAAENGGVGPTWGASTPSTDWVVSPAVLSTRWTGMNAYRMVADETTNHQAVFGGSPKVVQFVVNAA